ncbi:hypothetical protein AALB39_03190 [Lachnospiraceae bacterium 54-53]
MRKKGRNLLYAGICILALTGCSMNSYATTGNTESQTESRPEQPPMDEGIMAKITSADSSTITVVLADNAGRPEKDPAKDGQTSGETPPEKPSDGESLPEKPADGTVPAEKPADGSTQPEQTDGRGEKPEMEFNGETKTYTVSSSVVITKGMEQESASISDLTADSVVRLTLDGETVTGISIMN